MLELISSPSNLPFSVALVLMLAIAVLEGVGMIFGLGLSSFIDSLLPEIDVEIDADFDGSVGPMALSRLLGWLRFGQIPALIWLVVFLTCFGLIGLGIQMVAFKTFGGLMPGVLASTVAAAASLPAVRIFGGGLAKILPKDETEAVSDATFVGRVAVITLGTARQGSPAEARLQDQFGQSHYVMLEPDLAAESLSQGERVLIVSKAGAVFRGIKDFNANLVD